MTMIEDAGNPATGGKVAGLRFAGPPQMGGWIRGVGWAACSGYARRYVSSRLSPPR